MKVWKGLPVFVCEAARIDHCSEIHQAGITAFNHVRDAQSSHKTAATDCCTRTHLRLIFATTQLPLTLADTVVLTQNTTSRRLADSDNMASYQNLFLITILLLAQLFLMAPQYASATPTPTATVDNRSELAHKPGTCPPDYVWGVIQPISTLGATCCPDSYKAEQAKLLGDLAGVFCCPEDVKEYPCEEEDRELPRTPEVCPSPGISIGSLCMKYYW